MTKGKSYKAVVDGCGPAPVKFRVQKELARSEHKDDGGPVDEDEEDAPVKEGELRKIEVGVTDKGTIVARRVVYKKNGKHDGYKKFDSIEQAAGALNKSRPEEADAKKQLGQFVEGGGKAPGPVENAQGDI